MENKIYNNLVTKFIELYEDNIIPKYAHLKKYTFYIAGYQVNGIIEITSQDITKYDNLNDISYYINHIMHPKKFTSVDHNVMYQLYLYLDTKLKYNS